jgi:hypothetical protein
MTRLDKASILVVAIIIAAVTTKIFAGALLTAGL